MKTPLRQRIRMREYHERNKAAINSSKRVRFRRDLQYRKMIMDSNRSWKERHPVEANEIQIRYRERHREELKTMARARYHRHKDKLRRQHLARMRDPEKRKHRLEWYRNWCKGRTATPRQRFSAYKRPDRLMRGRRFELTFEQFMSFWQKPCFYCGSGIKTIGLDRIDNFGNYTLTNITPCCSQCNKAKHKQKQEDFISMCRRVAALHPV